MTLSAQRAPLDDFPIVRSTDVEEVGRLLKAEYAASAVYAHQTADFRVHANQWKSSELSLNYCEHRTGVTVEFPQMNCHRQNFIRSGAAALSCGRQRFVLGTERTFVAPPGMPLHYSYSPFFRQLVLRVSDSVLHRKLAVLMDDAPSHPLEFIGETDVRTPQFRRLERVVDRLLKSLEAGRQGPEISHAEMEEQAVICFLLANRHNYSAFLQGSRRAGPDYRIRRVQEFIAANWDHQIRIEDLCRAAGIGGRNLHYLFKRAYGYSPMQFAQKVRLNNGRALLQAGEMTVTQVSVRCGFGNVGQFAIYYKRAFGERPSETRGRGAGIEEPVLERRVPRKMPRSGKAARLDAKMAGS